MSEPLFLEIDVQPYRLDQCRFNCAKSSDVRVCESNPAAALLTDNPAAAVAQTAAGGWVMLLEPFSLDESVRQTLADSGRAMPVMTTRRTAGIPEIKAKLDEGKLGVPGLLRIHQWIPRGGDEVRHLPKFLDLATWLFGRMPEHIYAVRRPNLILAHLGFADGGMAVIDVDGITGNSGYFSFHLIGSRGAAYSDQHHNSNLLFQQNAVTADCDGCWLQPDLSAPLAEFANSVRQQKNLSAAWRNVDAVESLNQMVLQSARTGDAVQPGGPVD